MNSEWTWTCIPVSGISTYFKILYRFWIWDFTKIFFNLGFAVRKNFEQHMNIHTGAKPFTCNYCGRGFADDGNRRMHQKTTHEGYKRGFKWNPWFFFRNNYWYYLCGLLKLEFDVDQLEKKTSFYFFVHKKNTHDYCVSLKRYKYFLFIRNFCVNIFYNRFLLITYVLIYHQYIPYRHEMIIDYGFGNTHF